MEWKPEKHQATTTTTTTTITTTEWLIALKGKKIEKQILLWNKAMIELLIEIPSDSFSLSVCKWLMQLCNQRGSGRKHFSMLFLKCCHPTDAKSWIQSKAKENIDNYSHKGEGIGLLCGSFSHHTLVSSEVIRLNIWILAWCNKNDLLYKVNTRYMM